MKIALTSAIVILIHVLVHGDTLSTNISCIVQTVAQYDLETPNENEFNFNNTSLKISRDIVPQHFNIILEIDKIDDIRISEASLNFLPFNWLALKFGRFTPTFGYFIPKEKDELGFITYPLAEKSMADGRSYKGFIMPNRGLWALTGLQSHLKAGAFADLSIGIYNGQTFQHSDTDRYKDIALCLNLNFSKWAKLSLFGKAGFDVSPVLSISTSSTDTLIDSGVPTGFLPENLATNNKATMQGRYGGYLHFKIMGKSNLVFEFVFNEDYVYISPDAGITLYRTWDASMGQIMYLDYQCTKSIKAMLRTNVYIQSMRFDLLEVAAVDMGVSYDLQKYNSKLYLNLALSENVNESYSINKIRNILLQYEYTFKDIFKMAK